MVLIRCIYPIPFAMSALLLLAQGAVSADSTAMMGLTDSAKAAHLVAQLGQLTGRLDTLGKRLQNRQDSSHAELLAAIQALSATADARPSDRNGAVEPASVPTLTNQPYPFVGPTSLYLQASTLNAPIGFEVNQGFEWIGDWRGSGRQIPIVREGCCGPLRWIKTVLLAPGTLSMRALDWLYAQNKDSLYRSGGFVYSGAYDFAFGTQYSGPVISLEQNPALFWGYHAIDHDSSDENALYVGFSHQSNGMIIDNDSMYTDFMRQRKADDMLLDGQEYASMGWNYWWVRPVWNWGKPGGDEPVQRLSVELRHYIPQSHLLPWDNGPLEDTSNFVDQGALLGYEEYDGLRLHYSCISARSTRGWRWGWDLGFRAGQPFRKAFRNEFDLGEEIANGTVQATLRWMWDKTVREARANGFGLQLGFEYGHIAIARYWHKEARLSLGFTVPVQSSHEFKL